MLLAKYFLRNFEPSKTEHRRQVSLVKFGQALSLAAVLLLSSSAFAQVSIFKPGPIWEGEGFSRNALGDYDMDGDLDLFTIGQYFVRIYANTSSIRVFEPDPSQYRGFDYSNGRRLSLGDLDSDGDPDLVLYSNNIDEVIYIVINDDGDFGPFSADPRWSSNILNQWTRDVELADVDEDGNLDLICANGGYLDVDRRNAVYLNPLNENYEAIFFDTDLGSKKAVVGDLDLDGDLDILFANTLTSGAVPGEGPPDEPAPNTLFLNGHEQGQSPIFGPDYDWIYAEDHTFDMELGDIDGDGDLDLVRGGAEGVAVFLNRFNEGGYFVESIFDTIPAWQITNDPYVSYSITLGDVDRDNDIDLLVGWYKRDPVIEYTWLFLNVWNEGSGEVFERLATWEIPNSPALLGDVDGDGDLDLVAGGPALYRNVTSIMTEDPFIPPSFPASETYGVTLVDVDLDRDLDLICGNDGSSYWYQNFPFDENVYPFLLPVNPAFPHATRALVIGDIDRDGALDLALGNHMQETCVYEYNGSGFTLTPWAPVRSDSVQSVALGDVDGDGYPELVCGIKRGVNRLYDNDTGELSRYSVWETADAANPRDTRSVAFGDIDNDGDLDLICGNDGSVNTLYLNGGGTLADDYFWSSRDGNNTWSVALGDVDREGYLDVVCGNDDDVSNLYLNSGGVLAINPGINFPAWFSLPGPTRSVTLADVNSDGYLDLFCGNHGAGETLYLNVGGIFSLAPDWIANSADLTLSIDSGDIDDDGDPDLVVGSFGAQNAIYFNRRNPVFLKDFVSPTNHLPNNPTILRDVSVELVSQNTYRVQWAAFDVESDPFWLLLQFRYEDARNGFDLFTGEDNPPWRAAWAGAALGPQYSSPTGEPGEFPWDVSRLAIDYRPVILRLKVIEAPQRVSDVQHSMAFEYAVGPLTVLRPELSSIPELVFPGVTVGDTTIVTLPVTNTGNEILNVTSISLPSSEMQLDDAAPFTVPAGATSERSILLLPRSGLPVTGDVVISSDAPLTPEVNIPVGTDIHALTCDTRALLEGGTAPLGEALTIQVIPDQDVHVERCDLHYRSADGHTEMVAIDMTPQGGSFIGVIPGVHVIEAGLEYFIEMENSGVLATDPPGAPADSVFTIVVDAPVLIMTQPLPTSGTDFLEGRRIAIQVSLDQGVVYEQGTLNYRRGGESQYTSIPIPNTEPLPTASIPDSVVGPRGMEYWVQVQTSTSALTDPPTNPTDSPHTIGVRVADLVESTRHAGMQYRMVSVPLDFGVDFTGTLESLLSDQAAFGPYPVEPYEQGQWRCFRGFPPDGNYLELPTGATGDFRVAPGRGFWLISRAENWIATSPVAGTSTPTASAFDITLAPGWNLIGHPFVFPVAWNMVLVDDLPIEDTSGVMIDPPWRWDPASGYHQEDLASAIMQPFAGYFVYNRQDASVTLQVPPVEVVAPVMTEIAGAPPAEHSRTASTVKWTLQIIARCGEVVDGDNYLGVQPGARIQADRFDRLEPPPSPRNWLSLYFPHPDWDAHPGHYTVDLHGADRDPDTDPYTDAAGHTWIYDVAKDFTLSGVADEVQLEIRGILHLAPELAVLLLDRELLTTVDLRTESSYTFFLGRRDPVAAPSDARFLLLVGTEDYIAEQANGLSDIPLQTALLLNRPNPFNPATVIRYELAQAGQASLRIYDVSGALIRTLRDDHHAAGRHEVAWRGEDERGRQVAAGVYFYRLETAAGHRETRKMLLVK